MSSGGVLLIDDEPVVRESCARVLESRGLEMSVAARGDVGLDLLGERAHDLVILDLKMPGMDGYDVLGTIRDRWPHLPIIVITGYATVDTERECLAAGATAWLAKPFDPDTLLETLRDVAPGLLRER